MTCEEARVLRFVTTADTEILATAGAVERLPEGFPEVRCANPGAATDHAAFVDEVLDGARVVLCRVLGGRRGWQGASTCCARAAPSAASRCSRSAARRSPTPR